MINYEGCNCPVCKKPFTPQDDIVVCPVCGAPHHRACYQAQGDCSFTSLHSAGFEWKPPAKAQPHAKCPHCGAPCLPGQHYCDQCGAPLQPGAAAPGQGEAPTVPPPYAAEPLQGLTGEIDGIPVADWAAFIGPNAEHYLYMFKLMDHTGRRFGFVFSAAFIPPIYFLYRKMWGLGILAAAVNLLLNLPAMLVGAAQLGVFFQLPVSYAALGTIASVCSVLLWLIHIGVWGLFGGWFYRCACRRRIRRLQDAMAGADPAAYQARLRRQGGPSKLLLAAVLAFYLLGVTSTFFSFLFL